MASPRHRNSALWPGPVGVDDSRLSLVDQERLYIGLDMNRLLYIEMSFRTTLLACGLTRRLLLKGISIDRVKTELIGWFMLGALILPGALITVVLDQVTPLD